MEHLIIPPPPALKAYVKCFWAFQFANPKGSQLQVSTFVNDASGITMLYGKEFLKASVQGQMTNPQRFTPISHLNVFGVQFFPHALHELFNLNACMLTNREIQLNEFTGWNIADAMLNAESLQAKISLLANFLIEQARKSRSADGLVKACITKIQEQNGLLTVADLKESFAVSERQLERRFAQVIGVSPRHYIKVSRFQAALNKLKAAHDIQFTDVALALDYADQAHFIRHVKQLSGFTPKDLHKRLRKTTVNQKGNTPYLVDLTD